MWKNILGASAPFQIKFSSKLVGEVGESELHLIRVPASCRGAEVRLMIVK